MSSTLKNALNGWSVWFLLASLHGRRSVDCSSGCASITTSGNASGDGSASGAGSASEAGSASGDRIHNASGARLGSDYGQISQVLVVSRRFSEPEVNECMYLVHIAVPKRGN